MSCRTRPATQGGGSTLKEVDTDLDIACEEAVAVFTAYETDEEDQQLEEESEGDRGSCWQGASDLLHSSWFGAFVMGITVLNVIAMAIESDYPDWDVCVIAENVFLLVYFFEICLRLYVHQCRFFTDEHEWTWNLFDLAVTIIGIVDLWLSNIVIVNFPGGKTVTTLRILRLVRVLRAFRVLKHFPQLFLLVQGFLHSLQAVFWIGVLFLSLILVAGICVTTIVGQNAHMWDEPGPDYEEGDSDEIRKYFGTLLRSMTTMFQYVTLDNWSDISRLVAKRIPCMMLFFILYNLLAAFTMVALLTGVMAEHINSVSQQAQKEAEQEDFQEYVDSLEDLYKRRCRGGTQEDLSFDQIEEILALPEVTQKIQSLGAPVARDGIKDVLSAMDLDGNERVTWEEFRYCLKHIRGKAMAREVAMLHADVSRILALLQNQQRR